MSVNVKPDPRFRTASPEAERENALHRVTEAVQGVNDAIKCAVDTGVSVELLRESRCHDGRGSWGDQMMPVLRECVPVAGTDDVPARRL